MCNDIDLLFLNLSWNTPIEKYEEAVAELSKRNDYDLKKLIVPNRAQEFIANNINWKSFGQGCAVVICNKSDEEIISIFPELLICFQDLNWPGGFTILERINKLPLVTRKKYKEKAINIARSENDTEWIFFLEYILTN